jgi:hypothetical protein
LNATGPRSLTERQRLDPLQDHEPSPCALQSKFRLVLAALAANSLV